jgi:hypothetical protein
LRKGAEVAKKAMKHVDLDGNRDRDFYLPAVSHVAAGILIQNNQLVEHGTSLAREAAKLVGKSARRLNLAHPVNAAGLVNLLSTFVPGPNYRTPYPYPQRKRHTVCTAPASVEGGPIIRAIIDTGAASTTLSQKLVESLGLEEQVVSTSVKFCNADGSTTEAKGKIKGVRVTLGEPPHQRTLKLNVFVSKADTYDMLVGCDFLRAAKADLLLSKGCIEMPDQHQGVLTIPLDAGPVTPGSIMLAHLEELAALTPLPSLTEGTLPLWGLDLSTPFSAMDPFPSLPDPLGNVQCTFQALLLCHSHPLSALVSRSWNVSLRMHSRLRRHRMHRLLQTQCQLKLCPHWLIPSQLQRCVG